MGGPWKKRTGLWNRAGAVAGAEGLPVGSGPRADQEQGSWVPTAYLKPQLGHVSHQPVPTGLLLCLRGKTRATLGTKSWGHSHFPRDHETTQEQFPGSETGTPHVKSAFLLPLSEGAGGSGEKPLLWWRRTSGTHAEALAGPGGPETGSQLRTVTVRLLALPSAPRLGGLPPRTPHLPHHPLADFFPIYSASPASPLRSSKAAAPFPAAPHLGKQPPCAQGRG